jgi:hypothetical protein
VPIKIGDTLSKSECPQNDKETTKREKVPYASVVGGLIDAQVCTRPYITFVVNSLERYLRNPGVGHWKAIQKVM